MAMPGPYRRWTWGKFALLMGITSTGFFLMLWLGYGNCAAPKCWGDPIPVVDALKKMPKFIVLFLVVVAVYFGVDGFLNRNDFR